MAHLLPGSAYAETLRAMGAHVEWVPARHVRESATAMSRLRELSAHADVVHTQRWVSDLVGRFAARGVAPVVTTVQTSPYEPSAIARYSFLGKCQTGVLWLSDAILSNSVSDRVVAVSEYVRQMVIRRLRVPADRTRVVYNAIRSDDFVTIEEPRRAEVRAQFGLAPTDIAIVTVGHVVELKQQRLLVEAMPALIRRVPNAHLVVVGEGGDRPRLERRAQDLGISTHVRWAGLRADVPQFLGAMDLFALASSVEGLPLSAIEAMSCSVACVLSPIPPHRELQERLAALNIPEASLMVPAAHSAEAWADALSTLALLPEARRTLGRGGRAVVEQYFDARVTARALEQVFYEAIACAG